MVVEATKFWWQDSSCLSANVDSKKVAPICQHERIIPATSPIFPLLTTTPLCPAGWSEFEAHCYLFSGNESRLIWPNAENDCIHRGGHLASIHSQAEQDFIFSISTNYTWLGASDIVSEVGFYSYTICFYIDSTKTVFLKISWDKNVQKLFSNVINIIYNYAAKIQINEIVYWKLLHIIHPGEFFSLMGFHLHILY
jgi:hypothetical protein